MKQHRFAGSDTRVRDLLARDHTLHGGVLVGIDGHVIELQARAMEVLDEPMPVTSVIRISGMARGAVGESLDRIGGSFAKLRIPKSEVAITINLAPADLPKDGTWLDLPLAIIALQAAGLLPDIPETIESEFILMGELGLHGEIRRVPGVLSIAYIAKPGQKLIVPRGNEKEAALILAKPGHEGCKVLPVQSLDEVVGFFRRERKLDNALKNRISFKDFVLPAPDFAQVRGQEKARHAAKVCAAGGHNLLLIGPPGEGKSLIASALSGILPPLTREEAVELTRIYSATGQLNEDGYAVTRRPVRTVHHSASKQALVGGGSRLPRPGEVTLAHFGVLFLDELAEFSQSTLDTLRQPLEAGEVTISRVGGSIQFPCRLTLVAAMNPCPCGYFGTEQCKCDARTIKKYQGKVSGPILDRIDLQVPVERLSTEERFREVKVQSTAEMRKEVCDARARQHARFDGAGIPFNAAIPGGSIGKYCRFDDDAFAAYKKIVDENHVSTRSMDRLAKVAQTVSDLDGAPSIRLADVQQAADFVVGGVLREGF